MKLDSQFSSDEDRSSTTTKRLVKLGAALTLAASSMTACGNVIIDDKGETNPGHTQIDGGIDAGFQDANDAGMDVYDGSADAGNDCPAFTPDGVHITREQTAKLLFDVTGLSINLNGQTFQDVPMSNPDYDSIMTMANDNIMEPYKNNDGSSTFCWVPTDNLNRADFSKFVVESFGFAINTTGGPHFPDVQPGDWFYDYVETLFNDSIVTGQPNGLFEPDDLVTIDEANAEAQKALNPM